VTDATTRQRIAAELREAALTADELSTAVGAPTAAVYDHLDHVRASLDDETLLVAPPTCRSCGFDGFDDRLAHPSRCPDCRSERIEPPAFRIE